MSNFSLTRVSTATLYQGSVRNILTQQKDLSELVEKTTSGKRVLRPSDDPVSAAQAERARNRMSRLETDQRALDAQITFMKQGESTLGEALDLMQDLRERLVQAGNGSYAASSMEALAQEITSLRNELFELSNRKDAHGNPLFQGLGSLLDPVGNTSNTGVGGAATALYQGLSGQSRGGSYNIANALDGAKAFMDVGTGNGSFVVGSGMLNTGSLWGTIGQTTSPAGATPITNGYSIQFALAAGSNATDPNPKYAYSIYQAGSTTPMPGYNNLAYTPGDTIEFSDAVSGDSWSLVVKGTPKQIANADMGTGDSIEITPSVREDVFSVIDRAIGVIRAQGRPNTTAEANTAFTAQGLARALQEVDTAMFNLQEVRSFAGEQLKRGDRLESSIDDQELQQENVRSNAEDIDLVKAAAELERQKVAQSAALQTYASIQKLSLFNYIG